jgi:hypothetical protein
MIETYFSSDKWYEDGETVYADCTYVPFSLDAWVGTYEDREVAEKLEGKYLYYCRPIGALRREDTRSPILSKGVVIKRRGFK